MDDMGDHALCCPKLGTYARHNDLRNQFATLCTEIGLRVEMEVSSTWYLVTTSGCSPAWVGFFVTTGS